MPVAGRLTRFPVRHNPTVLQERNQVPVLQALSSHAAHEQEIYSGGPCGYRSYREPRTLSFRLKAMAAVYVARSSAHCLSGRRGLLQFRIPN